MGMANARLMKGRFGQLAGDMATCALPRTATFRRRPHGRERPVAELAPLCSRRKMSTSAINADAFVREVKTSGRVWAIRDSGGFPTSTNASGEIAMPFWSSEGRAKRVVETIDAYRNFQPVPVELSAFLDRWLPGLENDGLAVGLNWSGERATGYDLSPKDVRARFNATSR